MAKGLKSNIKNVYNRMMLYNIIISAISIIVGIVLLFISNMSNKLLGGIMGVVLLLAGLNSIYKYFHRDGAKLYSLSLVFGIIYVIIGVVLIVYPYKVREFVSISLALYIIVDAASKLNYSYWLKKGNEDGWLVILASGILLLIIGILIIFNPFVNLTIIKLVGAFLIIGGVLDLNDTVLFKRRAKEIMDIFW